MIEQLPDFDAAGDRRVELRQRRRRVALHQVLHQSAAAARSARCPSSECTSSAVIRLSATESNCSKQRLAVAHRAGRPAGENLHRLGLDLDALGRRDLREPRLDRAHVDAGEIEPLAAREDRDRNLVRLGRGEDELHVLRRLFQRLEQRVERLLA